MENSFSSSIIVSVAPHCSLCYLGYDGYNTTTFAYWGQEFTSGAAIVIRGYPSPLAFFFTFSTFFDAAALQGRSEL